MIENNTSTGLPFTYTDDICQISEHDVCFSGVKLTNDVGEFRAGHKFEAATIDFQCGHLTLCTNAGTEYRYSFAMNVGAKHDGHTRTESTIVQAQQSVTRWTFHG